MHFKIPQRWGKVEPGLRIFSHLEAGSLLTLKPQLISFYLSILPLVKNSINCKLAQKHILTILQ